MFGNTPWSTHKNLTGCHIHPLFERPPIKSRYRLAYCIVQVPDGRLLKKRTENSIASTHARKYPWSVTIGKTLGDFDIPTVEIAIELKTNLNLNLEKLRKEFKADLHTLSYGSKFTNGMSTFVYLLKLKSPAIFRIGNSSEVAAVSIDELLADLNSENSGDYTYNTERVITSVEDMLRLEAKNENHQESSMFYE